MLYRVLKQIRLFHGESLPKFAKRLKIPVQVLTNIEKGIKPVNLNILYKYEAATSFSVGDIFYIKECLDLQRKSKDITVIKMRSISVFTLLSFINRFKLKKLNEQNKPKNNISRSQK